MIENHLHGVICAMLTPFDEAGLIDDASVRSLVDYLIDGGVHGVMIAGTNGEGMLLSLEERKHLTALVTAHVRGRISVVAHVGCIDTGSTLALAQHAQQAGADAVAAIVPYFFTFDEESLHGHFTALCEAVPELPVYLYSFPGNAKNDISPAFIQQLAQEQPNVGGVKCSNPDMFRLRAYVAAGSGLYKTFCGVDGLMLNGMIERAAGQVSGNANAFPQVFRALYEAYAQQDLAQAQKLQGQIDAVRRVVQDGLHPAYFKTILKQKGVLRSAAVRRPMRDLSAAEYQQLERDLQKLSEVV